MNIRKALFSLFLACSGSFLVSVALLLPGLIWSETMILFGLLALILYLYITLPVHAITLLTLLFASFKYRVFMPVFGYYTYFVIWVVINGIVFQDFLFVEVPEKFEKWRYEQNYKDELALIRVYRSGIGSTETARALLEKGADPNIADSNFGISALTWAAYRGTEADVKLLIEAGANINHQVEQTFSGGSGSKVQLSMVTPLALGAINPDKDERYKITSLLLGKGADVRVSEPALGACGQADIRVLKLLMRHGADLWARDTQNKNCLYYTADSGNEALLDYLLGESFKREVVIDPLDQEITPNLVDIAATRGHPEVLIKLVNAGYTATQPERIERLLEKESIDTETKAQLKALLEVDSQKSPEG